MSVKSQDCDTCGNVDFCKYAKEAGIVNESLAEVSKLLKAKPFTFSMTCKHYRSNVNMRTPLKGTDNE